MATKPLKQEEASQQVVELVNAVVDGEMEDTATTTETGGDEYEYEYVYYYYDEDGDNGTVVDVKPATSNTKIINITSTNLVDIHTNTGMDQVATFTVPKL